MKRTKAKKRPAKCKAPACFYGWRGPSAAWKCGHAVATTDRGVPAPVAYEGSAFAYAPNFERVGKIAEQIPNAEDTG